MEGMGNATCLYTCNLQSIPYSKYICKTVAVHAFLVAILSKG